MQYVVISNNNNNDTQHTLFIYNCQLTIYNKLSITNTNINIFFWHHVHTIFLHVKIIHFLHVKYKLLCNVYI